MSRSHCFGIFGVLLTVLLLAAPAADAAIMFQWTGNTYPDLIGGVDGHVNFMVLSNDYTFSGDTFGTGLAGFDAREDPLKGSGALDTTAKYLYLFQTVNDGGDILPVSRNTVSVKFKYVTSWVTFPETGFTQGGNPTTASGSGPWLGGSSALPAYQSGKVVGGGGGVAVDSLVQTPDTNGT